MPTLESSQPCPALLPYVRAYAQRRFDSSDLAAIEPVPAQLEQVLNFEFGALPGLRRHDYESATEIWVGGAQISFPGYMHLQRGVESFAVFFQPAGLSRLFDIPIRELSNCVTDATSLLGHRMRWLWNRLGECSFFASRVALVEQFLLSRAACVTNAGRMTVAAGYLFRRHGIVKIPALAYENSLSLRQFEREFLREVGASPKAFARVARFQSALDAKAAAPQRTWLDVALSFGYFDQMHMIHDFEILGNCAPTRLLVEMGDVRPPALTSAEM
jgi:AraC-like DNA-binding protein